MHIIFFKKLQEQKVIKQQHFHYHSSKRKYLDVILRYVYYLYNNISSDLFEREGIYKEKNVSVYNKKQQQELGQSHWVCLPGDRVLFLLVLVNSKISMALFGHD